MSENFTLTIESGAGGVRYSIRSEVPVATRELMGALEMCKLMVFEGKAQPRDGETPAAPPSGKRALIESARKICLADEPLSIRAVNALLRIDVVTLEDLLRCTMRRLARTRNIGNRTQEEIRRYVAHRRCGLGSLAPVWHKGNNDYYAVLSDNSKRRQFDGEEERREWMARENRLIVRREEEGLS